jgi:hypothetical protein
MTVPAGFVRMLDESVRSDFQTLRDSYFNWLLICTAIVAIGVLFEEVESFSFGKMQLDISARRTRVRFVKRIAKIGWFLILIGVVGEGVFEGLVSKADGLIQTLNNTLLSSASDRASNAEIIARAFESQIADAERDAETAKTQAAASELARVRLEATVSPRSFSLEQQRLIIAAISKFSGHPAVIVSSYGLDGEAAAFGIQLISVIHAATGVAPVDRRAGQIVAGGFETGVKIRGPNSEQEFMSALKNALTSIGRMKEVDVNGPLIITGAAITSGVSLAAGTTLVGGREIVPARVPASGQVLIMIGVKPLPVLTAK